MKFLSSERLSQHKFKTPEGYLICTDAILARTGKQTYRRNEVWADSEDDTEVEVDRKEEEVFSPATLASFENKPITVEHPDEDVNAENHNELSVGFVRDVKRGEYEGQPVMLGTLVITDAQTIEEIENGEHTDLSCGYDCDIVDEENPQQRNIRGNHVALCQCGRAGIARIVDSCDVKDAEMINWEGKRVIIVKNPQEVFEDAIVKEYITYNGKKYWWFEGKSGRNYFVPQGTFEDSIEDKAKVVKVDNGNKIVQAGTTGKTYAEKSGSIWWIKKQGRVIKHVDTEFEAMSMVQAAADLGDSIKDDIVFDYTEEDLRKAEEMMEKATDGDEAKLLSTLVEKIKFELKSKKMEDKLIESGSEEAFKKNIATEIRSGKDPKQAAAIAYSIQRKNDSKKFEISYTKDSKNYIKIVRANSLEDAIKNFKGE